MSEMKFINEQYNEWNEMYKWTIQRVKWNVQFLPYKIQTLTLIFCVINGHNGWSGFQILFLSGDNNSPFV
jgi:hypothetical protein